MDNNEIIFKNLQKEYPNLNSITYNNEQLIFKEGTLALNGFPLQTILPSTFLMSPHNIYTYLGYQFYKRKEEEINKVFNLFPQLVITEEEEIFLKNFVSDYTKRQALYTEEAPILEKDAIFMAELMSRQKVISESFRRNLMAANIIATAYTNQINQMVNDNSSDSKDNSLEQGFSLTRTNSKYPIESFKENNNLGIAGFTTIFIIISIRQTIFNYI